MTSRKKRAIAIAVAVVIGTLLAIAFVVKHTTRAAHRFVKTFDWAVDRVTRGV